MNFKSFAFGTMILIATTAASARTIHTERIDDPVIKQMTIEKIGTEKLTPTAEAHFMGTSVACSQAPLAVFNSDFPSTGDVRIDMIINLGVKAYEIIKANGPVVTATTKTANALPYGLYCWNQLQQWSAPRSEVYRVSYKNLYGITMLDFQFRVVYSYGGRIGNVGRYLSNATIQYKKVDAKWGVNLDADVEIPEVLNVGTTQNPIGGMQMTINWTVSTHPISLTKFVNSATFFIAGDGRKTTLLD